MGGVIIPQITPMLREDVIAPKEEVKALSQSLKSGDVIKHNLHFVRIRDQMVSRLELEATRNVIISVGIMLLFTLPWIIALASISAEICRKNHIRPRIRDEEITERF